MKKVKKKKRSIFRIFRYKFNNSKTNKNTEGYKNYKKKKKNSKNKKVASKNGKKKRKLWKKIVTFILILGIIGVLSVAAFFAFIVLTSPKFDESAFDTQEETVIYDIDGNIVTTLGIEKRENVSYDELPQVLIDAIIATEDSRFFQHNGLDLLRFAKASIQQLLGQNDAGGASTLTMQIVKNNLTKQGKEENNSIEKIIRKFQDIYLAVFKVEKEYSKEEILEFYINDNGLGSNAYGVQTASKYYFGKNVSELTLPEAAMIAGLFQSPNSYNPYYKGTEKITKRRNTVLKLMVNHGYITKEEANIANSVKINDLLVGLSEDENKNLGYIDTVRDELDELGYDPFKVSMKVYTTMVPSIQNGIDKVLSNNSAWYWRDSEVQGAVAVIDVNNGGISAIGAGRNRVGERTYNYATKAKRQPGSTAKPLFDYGPGIEYNNWSSYQLFYDEPWTYTNGPTVRNWDNAYYGLITMRYALQVSRNIPAIKAIQQVGMKNSQQFAYKLGLDVSLNQSSENYRIVNEYTGVDNTINEAYGIGGVAEGYTPLEMAAAYACFANGGYYIKPHTITKIEFRKTGEVKEFNYSKERVMKDSTAYIMNNILESAVSGGGFPGGANVYGSHNAAKTGTSNYDTATMNRYHLPGSAVNDLWTVGYNSKYSVSVWYGYENTDEKHYNVSDNRKEELTANVWKYIPKDPKGWTMPSSVVAATVEVGTWPAQLASQYTPGNLKVTEYFVRGTQPTEVSQRFAKFSDVKNLATTYQNGKAILTWDYEIPKNLDEKYLKEYYSQSVFGKGTNTLVSARLGNNKDIVETFNHSFRNNPSTTLKDYGFGVYEIQDDDTLKLLSFVTEPKYEYTGSESTTLVVKTEYKNYKANASNGVKAKITVKEEPQEPENPQSQDNKKITITLAGKNTLTLEKGKDTYKEEGIKSVLYGVNQVTKDATVAYSCGDSKFVSPSEIETFIDNAEVGTYKIIYTVTYNGITETKSRTVIIK